MVPESHLGATSAVRRPSVSLIPGHELDAIFLCGKRLLQGAKNATAESPQKPYLFFSYLLTESVQECLVPVSIVEIGFLGH